MVKKTAVTQVFLAAAVHSGTELKEAGYVRKNRGVSETQLLKENVISVCIVNFGIRKLFLARAVQGRYSIM